MRRSAVDLKRVTAIWPPPAAMGGVRVVWKGWLSCWMRDLPSGLAMRRTMSGHCGQNGSLRSTTAVPVQPAKKATVPMLMLKAGSGTGRFWIFDVPDLEEAWGSGEAPAFKAGSVAAGWVGVGAAELLQPAVRRMARSRADSWVREGVRGPICFIGETPSDA